MKKIFCLFLIAICIFQLNGCTGELRKKFVRKKEGEKKETPIFKPEVYENEFSAQQRYANHYAFWKNAQAEIINVVSQDDRNEKRLKLYTSYALNEINQMHKLLIDEKQKEIEPYVKKLADLIEETSDSSYLSAHKHVLVRELKNNQREIEKKFSYNKMKDCLRQ